MIGTNTPGVGLNRIMLINRPINVTMTNNLFLDVSWDLEGFGITSTVSVVNCPFPVNGRDLYENNTFMNTLGRTASYIPIII